MKSGKHFLEKRLFDKALTEFQAAQVAARICDCTTNTPSEYLLKTFQGIQKQRDNAFEAQRRAEEAERAAKLAQAQAEQDRKSAEHQRVIAQRTLSYFFNNDNTKSAWGLNLLTGKYGVLNREGEIMGDGFVWDSPTPFTGDYTRAWRDDKVWFVNEKAEVISDGFDYILNTECPEYLYTDIGLIHYNGKRFETFAGGSPEVDIHQRRPVIWPFREGEKFGFIDNKASVVIPPQYDSLDFEYIEKIIGNRGGVIDTIDFRKIRQDTILSPSPNQTSSTIYSDLVDEVGGWIVAKEYENSAVIDSFNRVSRFKLIRKDSTWGAYDAQRTLLTDTYYDLILPVIFDSIYLLASTDTVNDDYKWKLFNASNGLYAPFEVQFARSWWNNNLLLFQPTNEKEAPYFDYSFCYTSNGKWVSINNFFDSEVIMQNQDLGLILSEVGNEKGYVLTYPGAVLNQRPNIGNNENRSYEGLSLVYSGQLTDTSHFKKGLLRPDGSVLAPPLFDELYYPTNGFRLAQIGNKFGYLQDTSGWALPLIYDEVDGNFDSGTSAVRKGSKWGHIDRRGRVVVPITYDAAYDFSDGLSSAKKNGKWGKIDLNGNWVIPPMYKDSLNSKFGRFPARNGKVSGYFNLQNQLLHAFDFEQIKFPGDAGWARFKQKGKWGFINILSFQEIAPVYDTAYYFDNARAWARKNADWYLLDTFGKVITIRNDVKTLDPIQNGYAIFSKSSSDGNGLLDANGKDLIPCEYWAFEALPNGNIAARSRNDEIGQVYSPTGTPLHESYDPSVDWFQNGLMPIDGGIVNQEGEKVLTGNFNTKLIAYRIYELDNNNKYGYAAFTDFGTGKTDPKKPIRLIRYLPPEYEQIGFPLVDEWLPVKKGGLWGFIHWIQQPDGTETPQLAIPCRYKAVVPFMPTINGKIAAVYDGNFSYFINEKGEILVNIMELADH